jgi:hypothetical protein
MSTFLVVAHQTASSPELLEKLRELDRTEGNAEFVLLVPATRTANLWIWVEGDDVENARQRAHQASVLMRRAGLTLIDSVIGSEDPLQSVRKELNDSGRTYEAVVVSTLPHMFSHWLRQDQPYQIRRTSQIRLIPVNSRAIPEKNQAARGRPAQAATKSVPPMIDLTTAAALRRSEVYGTDGKLGTISMILYDYATGDPVWLGVTSGPIPVRTFLLPAQMVRVEGGHAIIPALRDKILNQPHVDIGEGIPSLSDEQHLYQYFGITHDRLRELRALHLRDDLPGQQVNWQSIFEDEAVRTTR